MAIWLNFVTTISLYRRRKLLCCRSEWINELVSETIESEPTTNSVDFDPIFPILETETEFSSEYFTEMFLSYIFGPSVVKYGILSNNSRSKLHAVIHCLFLNVTCTSGTLDSISEHLLFVFFVSSKKIANNLFRCLTLFYYHSKPNWRGRAHV